MTLTTSIVQGNTDLAKTYMKPGDPIYDLLHQTDTACKRAASLASQYSSRSTP
jgi:hypothetical protein